MSKSFLRSCTTALALTVAGAGLAAHAAEPAADAAAPKATATAASAAASGHHHRGPGKHGHHMRGERPAAWIPGLGPLPQSQLDKLKLDAGQQAKLDQARQQQRELFGKMRQAREDQRKLFSSQVDAGKLDPHALLAQREQGREQFRQQADGVQKQWLALWDSLNPTQQQEVTQFVKARHAAMAERKPRRAGGAKAG